MTTPEYKALEEMYDGDDWDDEEEPKSLKDLEFPDRVNILYDLEEDIKKIINAYLNKIEKITYNVNIVYSRASEATYFNIDILDDEEIEYIDEAEIRIAFHDRKHRTRIIDAKNAESFNLLDYNGYSDNKIEVDTESLFKDIEEFLDKLILNIEKEVKGYYDKKS